MQTLEEMAISPATISTRGMMLMGYQRTRFISASSRNAWEAGDPAPLETEVGVRGSEIFRLTLDEVWKEYLPIRAALVAAGRRPESVIDIGCGQALNDVLLVKDFAPKVTLIDIEETFAQYHSWNGFGSGYASLADAAAFLRDNGATDVTPINPRQDPAAIKGLSADLVTSLISCGFHYPIGDYLEIFLDTLEAGGAVILDIRKRYFKAPDDALRQLMQRSRRIELESLEPKALRLMFTA